MRVAARQLRHCGILCRHSQQHMPHSRKVRQGAPYGRIFEAWARRCADYRPLWSTCGSSHTSAGTRPALRRAISTRFMGYFSPPISRAKTFSIKRKKCHFYFFVIDRDMPQSISFREEEKLNISIRTQAIAIRRSRDDNYFPVSGLRRIVIERPQSTVTQSVTDPLIADYSTGNVE